jgi:hypothetical protein
VDLSSNTEYAYQQQGWIYWVGVAKAMLGDNLNLHSGLKHFHHRLYGYNGETQIEREFFIDRAAKHLEARKHAENKFRKIKDRLDNAILDNKYDDFPRLFLELVDNSFDVGVFSGMYQEANTYAEREDPIPRQQFERRGAMGQRDATTNLGMKEKEGGKVEYVYNAWKTTGAIQALQQMRQFVSNTIKYAHIEGGNNGVMNENMLYMMEYDSRVQAAGGKRTLEALGVNNGSN